MFRSGVCTKVARLYRGLQAYQKSSNVDERLRLWVQWPRPRTCRNAQHLPYNFTYQYVGNPPHHNVPSALEREPMTFVALPLSTRVILIGCKLESRCWLSKISNGNSGVLLVSFHATRWAPLSWVRRSNVPSARSSSRAEAIISKANFIVLELFQCIVVIDLRRCTWCQLDGIGKWVSLSSDLSRKSNQCYAHAKSSKCIIIAGNRQSFEVLPPITSGSFWFLVALVHPRKVSTRLLKTLAVKIKGVIEYLGVIFSGGSTILVDARRYD